MTLQETLTQLEALSNEKMRAITSNMVQATISLVLNWVISDHWQKK